VGAEASSCTSSFLEGVGTQMKAWNYIKDFLLLLLVWPAIGIFYAIVYIDNAWAWWIQRYYTYRKIPYVVRSDKYSPVVIRTGNPGEAKKDMNKPDMVGLRTLLLMAPDGQLDKSMLPLIEKWDDEPSPLQVLEVLDKCIYYGAASGLVIHVLEELLRITMKEHDVTLEQLVPLATWRHQQ
jgi:hypothetical protein